MYTEGNSLQPIGSEFEIGQSLLNNLNEKPGMYLANSTTSSDINTGNTLVTWTDFPENLVDNNIYGQYFYYQESAPETFVPFGPVFRINSTQDGSQSLPATAINQSGQVVVGWEGNFQKSAGIKGNIDDDQSGIIVQFLSDPMNNEMPQYQPVCTQQIVQGGRILEVPDSIIFPDLNVNPRKTSVSTVSVRNNTLQKEAPIQYIQVTDLQGGSEHFVISIDVDDFMHSDMKHKISKSNLAVRSCDIEDLQDPACVETLQGQANEFEIYKPDNDDKYQEFSYEAPLTLAQSNHEIPVLHFGQWRFYPMLKLSIPPITVPGSYTSNITITLQ
jgi:hypothetical protein